MVLLNKSFCPSMSGTDGSAKRRGKDGQSLRSEKKCRAEDEFDDDLDLSRYDRELL